MRRATLGGDAERSDELEAFAEQVDEVLRRRGDLVAPVGSPTTLRAWDGTPSTTDGPFSESDVPLAGFSVIEARDLDEAIELTANTPCAHAKGAVAPAHSRVVRSRPEAVASPMGTADTDGDLATNDDADQSSVVQPERDPSGSAAGF